MVRLSLSARKRKALRFDENGEFNSVETSSSSAIKEWINKLQNSEEAAADRAAKKKKLV